MNLPYTRASGGANRSNRALCSALAKRGHEVEVVVPLLATPSRSSRAEVLTDLERDGIAVRATPSGLEFKTDGVRVYAVENPSGLRACLRNRLENFAPDWTLVSAEDPSQNLLAAALSIRPGRVVYLAHTPQMFPFGPLSLYPGKARTELVRRTTVVAISQFVADYVREWAGVEVQVIHFPHYGTGPFRCLGRFENRYILLMNASQIKGLTLFVELARRLPQVKFAAVPGYATTRADLEMIASLPNIDVLENRSDLDDLFCQTKVLVMPSLWAEGFGMTVVDAMLRGIPVLASDFGGLREAKLGTDYLLPIHPITRFDERLDDAMLPVPVVPEQDLMPWFIALQDVIRERSVYEKQSHISRDAALKFVSGLSVDAFERFLAPPRTGRVDQTAAEKSPGVSRLEVPLPADALIKRITALGPRQRATLIHKLRARQGIRVDEPPEYRADG